MKRKQALSIFLVMVMLLCGCASDKETAVLQQREQIIIWAWDETFNVKAARMAAEEYKKINENVEVIIETKEREEILTDTKMILSSKVYENLPDVIMIEDYDVQDVLESYESEFVELTGLVDYSKYVDFKSRLCAKDGHGYGIPFDCGAAALFYRIDILEQAGYAEEDMVNLTWDRYIEIGKDVYEKTGIPMLTLDPTDLPLVRLIMQSTGSWYVEEDGTTAYIEENEALKQALHIYQELLRSNVGKSVNGWNEFISAFQQGEVATVLSGGWIISSIMEAEEQTGLWRIAPIPMVWGNENAVAASNVGGSAWYVLKNSRNSKAATEFMVAMFAENTEFTDALISEIGIVPSIKNPEILSNYEATEEFFGGQQVTKILAEMADEVLVVNYGSKTYEIEDILESEFQNALVDGRIEECLKRAQVKAEAVARE